MSCIVPASMGGGQAVSCSYSGGYGGSPGNTTIKYISSSGNLSAPSISPDSPMSVGVTGDVRTMTPVKYNIDQSPGGSTLSVTFQDHLPLVFSRQFIALNDLDVGVPGGACVSVLGQVYHKPAGAPGVVDETTVRAGRAPRIKEGNSWKILGEEYIFYTSPQLAGAAAQYIGASVKGDCVWWRWTVS